MVDIYNYIDFREFLKDYFEDRRKRGLKITQRAVLQEMGITSSGFLANVISGKKNLTIDQVKSLAAILKMSRNESLYFKYMVYFSKAKSLDEKNDFFETLNSLRRKKLKRLNKKQLSLFAKWYYVVVREIIDTYPIKDDYKELAAMLQPPITPGQAKEAIGELERLEFIKRDKSGFYQQTDSLLTTGDEVQSFYVANFNRTMTDLEKQALETIPAKERDLSGVTVGLSWESFNKVKNEFRDLRKKVLQIAEEENHPDRVFRCNLKLFPVSKKPKR